MSHDLHVYLIPGMGADRRLYSRMNIAHGNVRVLEWQPHRNARNLEEYAHIMAEKIDTKRNVIVGSSMGGMMAVELSRIVKPLSTILLSAPTGRHQFPPLLKAVHRTRLSSLLRPHQIMKASWLADTFMGFRNAEERELFHSMLRSNGPEFIHFSLKAVLGWQNTRPPEGDFIQILGDRDKLFTPKRIPDAMVLAGGGHFTAFEKAEELSGIINRYLLEKVIPSLENETKRGRAS
jgi:pimeloyl-ACP methyl ester carboxylesterase